jgi:predicted unusual protein kinase regulating ubiquinone biosynthesis (AarF/ABC1/UbiB family)/nucleotide-binding universal stress UspA family protein
MRRVAVATDRSETAQRAEDWAAAMADRYGADLLVIQVLLPQNDPGTEAGQAEATRASFAAGELTARAQELAGTRGTARVIVDDDPAMSIVRAAEEAGADVLVVGNAGMSGRKEFLLGNVPNRISHNAQCTVVIVNTVADGKKGGTMTVARALPRPAAATAREEDEAPPLMGRAAQIGAVMAKHGLKELFGKPGPGEEPMRARARNLRAALEELGPTFCKLGQILSTRPDLVPPEFIEELATLQDNVPPLTEQQVVQVMEEELGVPWEDVFESIDPKPLAAGTIAEVHRATLADGSRVVVKVQRPGARDEIMRDLGLLELFAERTAKRPAFKQVVDMGAIVEHLSESLRRELDFRQEASNIGRMREVLTPYPRLDVPDVYADYTTERQLVMQEIQGGPIRDAPEGPARKEAARQMLESYYRQIMIDGFFHADPHPGNLMWWNDKIYFLDFGMVGEVGPQIRQHLMLLLLAFWQEDVTFLTDVTLMLTGEDQRADIDLTKFQQEVGEVMTKARHSSLKDIQLGPILQEVTEIAIRHDVPLPASMALTAKALAQMQLATAELDPDLDPFAVAGSFLARSLMSRIGESTDPRRIFYETQKFRVRLMRMVEAVERVTGARPGPKLQIQFRGIEGLEANMRRAGRRLSLALTAAGSLLACAITATSTHVASWVPTTLGVMGAVLTLGLVADLLRRGT